MYNDNPTINKIRVNGKEYKLGSHYDIQVVDIRPGDTIMIHVNPDIDLYSCEHILKEMQQTYPENHILLVNEHVLSGMTIMRKTQPINNVIDELELNTPIEKLYPDLFSTSGGKVLW